MKISISNENIHVNASCPRTLEISRFPLNPEEHTTVERRVGCNDGTLVWRPVPKTTRYGGFIPAVAGLYRITTPTGPTYYLDLIHPSKFWTGSLRVIGVMHQAISFNLTDKFGTTPCKKPKSKPASSAQTPASTHTPETTKDPQAQSSLPTSTSRKTKRA